MPRYLKINIICILFLVFTAPASSELYQYKDENGIMRLTDNIYSVPTEDRSQLEKFSEFEGLSDGLEILPIQNNSVPQTKKQTKTEKVIVPKTSKSVSATTEKKIITPNIPPDAEKKTASKSKKEMTSPFQPIISEKPIQEPDTKVSAREIHKSKTINIDRIDKKVTVQKAIPLTPSKNIKKISKPTAMPKTVAEPKIVFKDKTQKIITEKSDAIPESKTETKKDITKTAKPDIKGRTIPETKIVKKKQTVTKSNQTTATKKTTKSEERITNKKIAAVPKTAKSEPDTKIKTIPKTKTKKQEQPEKIAARKTALKSKSNTETQKAIKSKDVIAGKKVAVAQEPRKKLPAKNVKKDTQTNIKEKASPKIKPETKIVKKDPAEQTIPQKSDSETKETVQAKIKTPDQKSASAAKTAKEGVRVPGKTADSQKATTEHTEKAIKKPIQTNMRPKAVLETKQTDADGHPDTSMVKKNSDSVIVASITNSNKPAETKKTNPATRQITSKVPDLIKYSSQTDHDKETAPESQTIEADNNKVKQKDESIILAKLESTRRILSNKKEALNKKFLSLMKEKQEIENSVDEDDEKSVLKYNENVKKLNIKIKQYKKKKKILQAKIEKYNNTIKQSALN